MSYSRGSLYLRRDGKIQTTSLAMSLMAMAMTGSRAAARMILSVSSSKGGDLLFVN